MMQNWLADKYIGLVPRGALQGMPCVAFKLTEVEGTNREVREIFDFVSAVDLRSKVVMFLGAHRDQNANALAAIIQSLAQAGIMSVVETNGETYQSYFTLKGAYTIVVLDGPDWASFPCAEVHYRFTPGTTLEPTVPAKCNLTYLIPEDRTTMRELMVFMSSSSLVWRVGQATAVPRVLRLRETSQEVEDGDV